MFPKRKPAPALSTYFTPPRKEHQYSVIPPTPNDAPILMRSSDLKFRKWLWIIDFDMIISKFFFIYIFLIFRTILISPQKKTETNILLP